MTCNISQLKYRVTLDTKLNLFVVTSKDDETKFTTGKTIQDAVNEFKKID